MDAVLDSPLNRGVEIGISCANGRDIVIKAGDKFVLSANGSLFALAVIKALAARHGMWKDLSKEL